MAGQSPVIRFGTDGWRGVIARDFTFDNVARVAAAISRYLIKSGDARKGLAVGYDRRFLSDRFARVAAGVAARAGIPVLLASAPLPTPALAFAVKGRGLGGGVMVTASHNPPEFNGIKFKPPYGGSATPEVTAQIETELSAEPAAPGPGGPHGVIEAFDPREEYLGQVLSLVDTARIRRAGLRVVADAMHGAAAAYLGAALARAGCQVRPFRVEENPGFGGHPPEPIGRYLAPLAAEVRRGMYDVAFALDGDGDRIGIIDEEGRFVDSHRIFSLLLLHLVENRGERGEVVKTVSTSSMVDRLAGELGLVCHEVPIGFKNICRLMLERDVLVGGEESGGIGIRGHLPERDGILCALLCAELLATSGQRPSQLVAGLLARTGPHYYDRWDRQLDDPEPVRARLEELRAAPPPGLAGLAVSRVVDLDGLKLIREDGSWVMLRPSGTEPVVRIYGEGRSPGDVRALLEEGLALLGLDAKGGTQTQGPGGNGATAPAAPARAKDARR